ncbi:hypothetical protein M0R45_026984 [Rubus argutus]|uniref:Uncharacterized protein n=1 Tax=Rubus argutus TaxID=59490 RepID=A0AAW1WYX8_RUBAR
MVPGHTMVLKKKTARGKRKLNKALEYSSEEEGSNFLDVEAQQSHKQQQQEGSVLGKLFTSLRKFVSAVTRKDISVRLPVFQRNT